jgi:hypothetical protein
MEMVVGELSVPDVCFVEQQMKYDETERPELVAEKTKKVASESQSPSENDETDVGKEVEIEEEESDEEDDEVRSLDIDVGKWVSLDINIWLKLFRENFHLCLLFN